MALTSPRFASNSRLQKVAVNQPPMKSGEKGEPVRIVQQALIDLGFDMPLSTRRFGSPDGIYGQETLAAARAFQQKFKLGVDGVTGKESMTKLDELLRTPNPLPPVPVSGFTHRINLHLRSIDNPTVSEFTQLDVMKKVFAQYGIDVQMLSGESVQLSPGEALTLEIVDGDCKWDQASDEQKLLQNSGSKQNIGPNDITVYFATTLREQNGNTLQGCAGTEPSRPAVMIAASAIDKTTMAHEVCHVLLGSSFSPVHDDIDSANLMCGAAVCTGNPAHLDDKQLKAIRGSKFLHRA